MSVTKLIMTVLVIMPLSLSNANIAVQSDWSAGDGIPGPICEWGNEFYQSSCIDWSDFPGSLLLSEDIQEYTVEVHFKGATSVYSEDINGDGYMDILGAARYGDNNIVWWENSDTSPGIYWVAHTIAGDLAGTESVYSEDIDGDGDMDVLGAYSSSIAWWENIDGSGASWTKHIVAGYFINAKFVYSEDIDADGDMDVLGASSDANDIAWWDNIDGSGTSWTEHIVEGDFIGAACVHSQDMDNDGDMDILGAAFTINEISWWENSDTGAGIYWIEHVISDECLGAHCVYSQDIDSDGDMAFGIYASCNNEITWWENIDGSGTSWAEYIVDGDFTGAASVYSEDMDNDGDMDILGAAFSNGGIIAWWDNSDTSPGMIWVKHTVDRDFAGAVSIYSEDINCDGNMDILGAALSDNDITWWDLNGYYTVGTLESSILEIDWPVDNSIEWGEISWLGEEPSNTELSFLVRASDDPGNLGSWSDTIIVSGTNLAGLLGEYDRYLQYMAILETCDSIITPILDEINITWDFLGIEGTTEPIPAETELLPFSPNPTSAPYVRFGLPEYASVRISIFDLSGRLVSEIHGDEYSPGFHYVPLRDLSPGIYFCRMISRDFIATHRFVVIE